MRMTISLTAVLAVLAAHPVLAESPVPADTATAPALPAITVATVTARTLTDRVMASGIVAPVETVNVAPLVEGQPIEALLVDVGDKVAAGQVMARLSKTTLELQLSQAKASLESAKATIAQAEAQLIEAQSSADEAQRVNQRTAQLKAQGTASQASADTASANAIAATARLSVALQSREAARANLELVKAQLANFELQLNRTEVTAPVAGEVVARNALVGAIATAAGQPMFSLIRDAALELTVDVAEGDLLRLAPGQPVVLHSVGGESFPGHVRLVEPAIDLATRLGRARISFDQGLKVRSGMFMQAEIIVARHDGLAVPVTAVGSKDATASVMVVSDGRVTQTAVQTGIRDGGWVEIVGGLTAGAQVVAKAGAFVRDGDRINPVVAAATN